VQANPGAILEVGRILLEHLVETGVEEPPDSPFVIDVVQNGPGPSRPPAERGIVPGP
jgi:hypothetical protein